MVLNTGATQYTCPTYSTKVCFIVATVAGNITTSVNKGIWDGSMNGLLLLDVYVGNQWFGVQQCDQMARLFFKI